MQTSTLIAILFVLALILIPLLLLYTRGKKERIKKKRLGHAKKEEKKIPSFERLYGIVKDPNSSESDLKEATEAIIKYYGDIPPKRGIRPDPLFKKYATLIVALARHRNTNKDIIINFDRALQKQNPSYALEIEDFLQRGLNSRG